MTLPASCDLLVIGGGINGAAIARDAAGRGLKVVLAERGDLACGTSQAMKPKAVSRPSGSGALRSWIQPKNGAWRISMVTNSTL